MTRKIIFTVMGMLLSISSVFGQDGCPALIERALQAVSDNCNNLDRNTACYAYNQVQATFSNDVDNELFSQPADRAELTFLNTIQTTPLDEANDIWGIAMMSVQANVPGTLPGQAVIFMLMGDTQVENAVAPEDALIAADPIPVTTLVASANIRLAPAQTGYVLGTVPRDTSFEADGLSPNGEWVRIIYDDQPAWIFRNIINSESSLANLPILSDDNRTPMQAFYFSTGTGASICNEAPDSLMIQGPNSMQVEINANGIDINIGSTLMLESTAPNQLSFTAISGFVEIGNVRIPGGFTIDAQTADDGTVLPESLSGLRPMEDEKIERYRAIEQIEGNAINYQINVLNREQINAVQVNLERGQQRENLRSQCIESGLTREQCASLVGSDTDPQTIYNRCLASGISAQQCRAAASVDNGVLDNNRTIDDRCRQAGFATIDDCRNEYAGESDERIQICTALGHNSRAGCRNAFPDDSVDNIINCVSRGFATKAACDASDSGVDDELSDDSSTEQNECQSRGLTQSQCRRAKRYRECRSRGFTAVQCQSRP